MFLFVIYNSIYIPLEIAFGLDKPVGQCVFDYFVDLCFIADMCLNMRTVYYNQQNELVMDPKTIVRKYVCSYWFVIDFLAVFPFDLLVGGGTCGAGGEDGGGFTAVVGLLKAFRLLRLLRFRKELDKLSGANVLRVVVSLCVFLLVAHLLACAWWGVGLAMWYLDEDRADAQGFVACNGTSSCAWLRRIPTGGAKLTPDTPFIHQYLSSLYWSLTTLMKTPFVGPDHIAEKIFGTLAIALGAVCYAVFLSTVQNAFQTFTKNAAQKRDAMTNLVAFATSREVSPDLTKKLAKQSTTLYEWTNGLVNSQVLMQLPSHLRGIVALKLYGDLNSSNLALFSKTSQECAKGIATRFKCQVLIPDAVLIAKGEPCNMLYILQKGVLKVATVAPGSSELPPAQKPPPPASPEDRMKSRRSSTKASMVPTFRELSMPGTPIGLIEPKRSDGLGKYPFYVTATKKTHVLQISQGQMAMALDGFPEDEKAVRKFLSEEQRKLVSGLQVEITIDSPLGTMEVLDQREQIQKEDITDDVLDRVMEIEKSLEATRLAIDAMTNDLEALPHLLKIVTMSKAAAADPMLDNPQEQPEVAK